MRLIEDLGMQYPVTQSKQKKRFGIYECSLCKDHVRVCTYDVKHKRNTSRCDKCKGVTHNMSGSDIYNVWQQMKDRCYNSKSKAYKYYGKKGVSICSGWLKFEGFLEWAMSNGYKKGLTIDRRDSQEDKRIKISIDDASEICEAYDTGIFIMTDFAKAHNVSKSCINHIIRRSRL